MTYAEQMAEGADVLAAMPLPSKDDLAIQRALDEENAAVQAFSELALAEGMLRWANPSDPDSDDPRCEFCEVVVPDGGSDHPPFCSADCERAANSETYASLHPRPEEVD